MKSIMPKIAGSLVLALFVLLIILIKFTEPEKRMIDSLRQVRIVDDYMPTGFQSDGRGMHAMPYCIMNHTAVEKCSGHVKSIWDRIRADMPEIFKGSGEYLPIDQMTAADVYDLIEGKRVLLIGDSQTRNFFYALTCFLHTASNKLQTEYTSNGAAVSVRKFMELYTSRTELTRITLCVVFETKTQVCYHKGFYLDQAVEHVENLTRRGLDPDLLIWNTGLHYRPKVGPIDWSAKLRTDVLGAIGHLQRRLPTYPVVWMETPAQHFQTPEGGYTETLALTPKPRKCGKLSNKTIYETKGPFNAVTEPLKALLGNYSLDIWEASAKMYYAHIRATDCTHWCHPSSYQVWVHLLYRLLVKIRL
jgi:hypothetical protein